MRQLKNSHTLSTEQVADLLEIPILAVGQCIFDRKLSMSGVNTFRVKDVNALKQREDYLESLR